MPNVTTTEVTNILATSATSGGTITDEGSGTVTARGVCWSTSITPNIDNDKTSYGSGTDHFCMGLQGRNISQ